MPAESLFFGEQEQQLIIEAIREAEMQTSGEIKVHIEKKCAHADVMERAKEVFGLLNLHLTEASNGVLFYLAYEDRKFAVLGDSTKDLLRSHFSQNQFAKGLCAGIAEAGSQLKALFPRRSDDINELPDDISFGA
jgi:uncharacterized membrane protein